MTSILMCMNILSHPLYSKPLYRRYWGDVLMAQYSIRPDGSDSSEYKVSLASEPYGTVIGEASFVGVPPFHRVKGVPAKNNIKKFVKSSASKSLFPGSPWILHVPTRLAFLVNLQFLIGRFGGQVWHKYCDAS